MTLARLDLDTPATVRSVGGTRALRLRLMELGIVPGTRILKLRVAPLGDPIEIAVRGGRLSIRAHEAAAIELEPR